MEYTIYSGYAYSSNERECSQANAKVCKYLNEKYKCLDVSDSYGRHQEPTKEQLDQYDFIYSREDYDRYIHAIIYKCPEELDNDERAVIVSNGSLYFGYGCDVEKAISFRIYND